MWQALSPADLMLLEARYREYQVHSRTHSLSVSHSLSHTRSRTYSLSLSHSLSLTQSLSLVLLEARHREYQVRDLPSIYVIYFCWLNTIFSGFWGRALVAP